jgi:hypothetical protein
LIYIKNFLKVIIITCIIFSVACSKTGAENKKFDISIEKIVKDLNGVKVTFGKESKNRSIYKTTLLKKDSFELKEVQTATIDKYTNVIGFIIIKEKNNKKLNGIFAITYTFDNKWKIKDPDKDISINISGD